MHACLCICRCPCVCKRVQVDASVRGGCHGMWVGVTGCGCVSQRVYVCQEVCHNVSVSVCASASASVCVCASVCVSGRD
jgi:hypothetical protein